MERILADALGQDVTKLAQKEKQMLLSRLLSRFAHEIRNPLSSLDIHVQLLEEDIAHSTPELRAKSAGRFEIIRGELHRLENIVQHFLSLAGPSALNIRPVEIGKIIAYVGDLLRPEAAGRAIEIAASVPENLPSIPADPAQLTQALLNLVINSIQAIERNGRVELSAEADADILKIKVRDTGPGIPPEKQSAIFEPFFTTKPEGSGLGLWIVQQIIVAHAGAVTAANAPERGALFTIKLPLRPKDPPRG